MKVEKIHEKKISVFISMVDLKEKNIDILELYPQSSTMQSLFLDILEEAYLQQGFETDGHQLFVEAKPLPNHGFYISITKFNDEEELDDDYSSGYIIDSIENFSKVINKSKSHELIFAFPSIESIEPCMNFLTKYSYEYTGLFQLDGKYIFAIIPSPLYEQDIYSTLTALLSEHGAEEFFSIAYVDEHGKRLLHEEALESLEKYFSIG